MAKTVYTNQQVIDQIDSGYHWTTGGSTATAITYGIATDRSWFPSGYGEYSGWSALNAKQAAAANLAIELWDDLIASSITASATPNTADIRFSNSSTGVNYAHAYFPGETGTDTYTWQQTQGSVWLNPAYNSLSDPDVGEYGFMAVLHEIGHALGLDHPGTYNGGSPTYANDALYEQDTHMYTVMSYFDAANTGADWYAPSGWWTYAQTPMVHDVLAIQSAYGADFTTRAGDTVYGFNSTADNVVFDFTQNSAPVVTIWDGGGNDTIDLSGWNTASQISLVAGSYSHGNAMTYNIAIAYGADIENASGGGGNDQITGNDLANTLLGHGGSDLINGGAGDDWIDGGAGYDTLVGGAGNDTFIFDALDNLAALDGGTGDDLLIINGGSLPVLDLTAHGFEFADHVRTDDGSAGWTEITNHYLADWQLTSQDGILDDSRSWHTEWDYLNAQPWYRQITYQDTDDNFSWIEHTYSWDDQYRLYEQVGSLDDGRDWHVEWDQAHVQPWTKQISYQDADNSFSWIDHSYRFDSLGRRYEQVGNLDDGRTWYKEWDIHNVETWATEVTYQDAGNNFDWTENSIRFDDQARLYDQTGTYDDGRTWQSLWDTAGSETWHKQTHIYDSANSFSWSEQIFEYDLAGNLIRQEIIDDILA